MTPQELSSLFGTLGGMEGGLGLQQQGGGGTCDMVGGLLRGGASDDNQIKMKHRGKKIRDNERGG